MATRTVDINGRRSLDESIELPDITVDVAGGLPHVTVYEETGDGWQEVIVGVAVTREGKIKLTSQGDEALKVVVTTA